MGTTTRQPSLHRAEKRPYYSIIVTLPKHRGNLPSCVASWTCGQKFDPNRFEFLLMSDGREPLLEQSVKSLFREQDRILVEKGAVRSQLYDWGVRSARGDIVVFSESHCTALPDFLSELDAWYHREDFDGACCRTIPVAEDPIAKMDALVFEEGFKLYREPGDWRKINVHAFALKKSWFDRAGGLDARYNLFSEMILAARLRDMRARLAYADGPAVLHHYRSDLKSIREAVQEFARDESRYRKDHAGCHGSDQLDFTVIEPQWNETQLSALARSMARGLIASGEFSNIWNACKWYWRSLELGRIALWRAWWEMKSAEWQCLLNQKNASTLEHAFRKHWRAAAKHARIRFLGEEHKSNKRAPLFSTTRLSIDELSEYGMLGFHGCETHNNRTFRWSQPTACFRLPPITADELVIELGQIHWKIDEAKPVVFFNGKLLAQSHFHLDAAALTIKLGELQRAPTEPMVIGWKCNPLLPSETGSEDPRAFGLPVIGVHTRTIAGGSTREAA